MPKFVLLALVGFLWRPKRYDTAKFEFVRIIAFMSVKKATRCASPMGASPGCPDWFRNLIACNREPVHRKDEAIFELLQQRVDCLQVAALTVVGPAQDVQALEIVRVNFDRFLR